MKDVDRGLPLEDMKNFSLKELLGMAIKAEIGAANFYSSLAENMDIEALRDKIEFLAGEERKHEAFLRKLYAQMFPGEEVVFPKEHIGPELKPVAEKLKEIEDVIDLYRWAMEAEKIANEFYLKLEDMVEDESRIVPQICEKKADIWNNIKFWFLFRSLPQLLQSHFSCIRQVPDQW